MQTPPRTRISRTALALPLIAAASILSTTATAAAQANPSFEAGPLGGARPLHSVAVAFQLGTAGLGAELATPLASHLALRAGAQYFHYATTISTDGLNADGTLSFTSGQLSLDVFPFRHSSFHLSPGVALHNDNHVAATLNVPPGNSFTLGDTDYTSDPADPIAGNTRVVFGKRTAPRFTLGWGSMFPRNGGHWSFPTEIGFEYVSYPTVSLALSGSGCDTTGCGPINDPSNASNITAEVNKLNSDLAPFRFYPVLSIGVSCRIGR